MIFLSKPLGGPFMENIIISLLNIDSSTVQTLSTVRNKDQLSIHITLKKQEILCQCDSPRPLKFKEYYTKKIKHSLIMNMDTILYYKARRYQCSCCYKTLYEPNPFTTLFQKKTFGLSQMTMTQLMKPEYTFTSVAQQLCVSPTTILNIFDSLFNDTRQSLPNILCLDELYFSRYSSYKYCCVLVNFESQQLVDLVESCRKFSLSKYFDSFTQEERDNVKVVCIDFYDPYRQVIRLKLRKATICICIDHFHIIQLVNRYLDQIRIKTMKNFTLLSN